MARRAPFGARCVVARSARGRTSLAAALMLSIAAPSPVVLGPMPASAAGGAWRPTGLGGNLSYGPPDAEPDAELLCMAGPRIELRVFDPTGASQRDDVRQVRLVGLGAVQAEAAALAPIERSVITMTLDGGSLALTALLVERDFEVLFPGARITVPGAGASGPVRELVRTCLGGQPTATSAPASPSAAPVQPAPAQAEVGPKPLRLDTPARFSEYPAGPVYRGPAAPVVLDTDDKRSFRTRLRATASEPVAFAGAYALTLWGCGGGCVQGAVVSKRTGAVTFLPGSASGWGDVPDAFRPFVYRPDSNLLVMFGQVDGEGPVAATFYRFVNGTFVKFKIVPVAPDMSGWDAYVARF